MRESVIDDSSTNKRKRSIKDDILDNRSNKKRKRKGKMSRRKSSKKREMSFLATYVDKNLIKISWTIIYNYVLIPKLNAIVVDEWLREVSMNSMLIDALVMSKQTKVIM